MNGWGWVIAGYGLLLAGLGSYTVSIVVRVRRLSRLLE